MGGPRGISRPPTRNGATTGSLPEELRKVKLPISDNHHRNFLDSVKSRKPTITPVETAHHSAIPGHLGLISMLVGRKLKWDAQKEQHPRRCGRQQAAQPALPRAVADRWIRRLAVLQIAAPREALIGIRPAAARRFYPVRPSNCVYIRRENAMV